MTSFEAAEIIRYTSIFVKNTLNLSELQDNNSNSFQYVKAFRCKTAIFCVHFRPFPASCIYNNRKTDAKRGRRVAVKSLSIRIDSETLDKLHVIAEYEGRSANSQILILIRNCIETYEKEKGIIHGRK